MKTIFLCLFFGLFCASSASGLAIYSYESAEFNRFQDLPNSVGPSFEPGDRLTVSVALEEPLSSNLVDFSIADLVVEYSFHDGTRTLNQHNSRLRGRFSTGATGDILNWKLSVASSRPLIPQLGAIEFEMVSEFQNGMAQDIAIVSENLPLNGGCCLVVIDAGLVVDQPSSWQLRTTPIPEPSSAVLLGIGLLSLARFNAHRPAR